MNACTVRHCAALLPVLYLAWSAEVSAQNPRAETVRRAVAELDAGRRVNLLAVALNPLAGPVDTAWASAVQMLAEALLERGDVRLAAVWLRWALRQTPDLKADTVRFLPEVAVALQAAREFVARTRTPDDSLPREEWRWPAQDVLAGQGRLQVDASIPAAASVWVSGEGMDTTLVTQALALAPSSYGLQARAPGYRDAAITREVLPGVTTVVAFRLRPLPVQVAQAPAAAPPVPRRPAAVAPKRKGFPWLWVGVGAAAVTGGTLALLGGKSKVAPFKESRPARRKVALTHS